MSSNDGSSVWGRLGELVKREVFPQRLTSILLYGPPGTGKSTWPREQFGADNVEIIPICEGVDLFALLGAMMPCVVDGKPTIQWVDGPAARAVRQGKILVLDEIDRHSPELQPLLHALTECDPKQIRVRCADGSYIVPAPGYGVVATSNASPDKLPEALRSRFLSLYVDQPAPGLLDNLGNGLREFFTAAYTRAAKGTAYLPPITPRVGLQMKAMCEAGFQPEEAMDYVFGVNAPADLTDALLLAVK